MYDPGGPTPELVATYTTLSVALVNWLTMLMDSIRKHQDNQQDKPRWKFKLTVEVEIN